jgi:O-antigen ligase
MSDLEPSLRPPPPPPSSATPADEAGVSSFEQDRLLQRGFWFSVIGVTAVVAGYLLAVDSFLLALAAGAVLWGLLLPFHARIAAALAVVTFSSALIMPVFPGRPYLWEFAALLAWSGLVVTLSLRRQSPDFERTVRAHRWLFMAVAGYCAVLVATMFYRGVGLRILGSAQMGGRFYFQQLACAIFPLLFAACEFKEKALTRLFLCQCVLTGTYLVSDFAFSFAPKELYFLLAFFELPGDAINFEIQSRLFGLRRFQSLAIVGQGFVFALLTLYSLKHFYGRRALYLVPLLAAVLGVGIFSGHRWVILIVGLTVLFCAWAQRFFNLRNSLISAGAAGLLLAGVYGFSERLPLTVQRAISVLPGIRIDHQARADGASTLETRSLLRKIGWEMIPDYVWLGRGFGQSSLTDYSSYWDPTMVTWHVNQGRFYNGIIGLMVNTGVFGTAFMLLFLATGTLLAWRIMALLRRQGCHDSFARMCSVVASLWMANAIAFILIHGDSEFAMKTFSLQAGLLLACHLHLQRRRAATA